MKTHHYSREETDTFDEVNKVFNELRDEIVAESEVVDNAIGGIAAYFVVLDEALTELSSRIAKLEKPTPKKTPKKEPPIPKKKTSKKKKK